MTTITGRQSLQDVDIKPGTAGGLDIRVQTDDGVFYACIERKAAIVLVLRATTALAQAKPSDVEGN